MSESEELEISESGNPSPHSLIKAYISIFDENREINKIYPYGNRLTPVGSFLDCFIIKNNGIFLHFSIGHDEKDFYDEYAYAEEERGKTLSHYLNFYKNSEIGQRTCLSGAKICFFDRKELLPMPKPSIPHMYQSIVYACEEENIQLKHFKLEDFVGSFLTFINAHPIYSNLGGLVSNQQIQDYFSEIVEIENSLDLENKSLFDRNIDYKNLEWSVRKYMAFDELQNNEVDIRIIVNLLNYDHKKLTKFNPTITSKLPFFKAYWIKVKVLRELNNKDFLGAPKYLIDRLATYEDMLFRYGIDFSFSPVIFLLLERLVRLKINLLKKNYKSSWVHPIW